jgi:hypothetical protein
MQCDRCQANIEPGEEEQHLGQTLCEDCYMDALSPVKTCDPWAVHSAKSFEKHAESTPTLRPIQSEITSNSLFYTACRLKPCPSILKVRYVQLMANHLTFQNRMIAIFFLSEDWVRL